MQATVESRLVENSFAEVRNGEEYLCAEMLTRAGGRYEVALDLKIPPRPTCG